MKIILFILFLFPFSVHSQSDSMLLSDIKKCHWYLMCIAEYPYYNTIEIKHNENKIDFFLLFYKIDSTLYEDQIISVALDDYENQIQQLKIPEKYFHKETVIQLISLFKKNNFSKIEFKGVGDCTSCAVLITKDKDGYIYSDGDNRCIEWCTFSEKSRKDKFIFERLLYISNIKKYLKN